MANLSNGIDSAYNDLGVPKLIDPEDMAKGADELGNMTYLYHFMDKVSAARVAVLSFRKRRIRRAVSIRTIQLRGSWVSLAN